MKNYLLKIFGITEKTVIVDKTQYQTAYVHLLKEQLRDCEFALSIAFSGVTANRRMSERDKNTILEKITQYFKKYDSAE
jgi:hypothetical protein